ncbi:sensor histidine kinase [Herbiconiux flava]|uniref:histidine kinase n=1 Tax=Herbiconiux flava TaxID=881268 RepID=A0A852STA9_9MICO|nr:histidine kinase [Herbiconiux flava]NYD72087.1 signal transduction histidine kinase [Herbiconiux flava]GLK17949.1 two-component sensor histidine kinase [Herbiconiux flava]
MTEPDRASEWEPRFRFSGRAALWLPVIVSFVVQVPATVWLARAGRAFEGSLADDPWRLAARLGLAIVGPVALIFARRFPGPVVAVVAAAAGAYTLLVAGGAAPPYVALAFAILGAVVRGARSWAIASIAVAWVVTIGVGVALGVPWQAAPVTAATLALVLLVVVGGSIRSRRARYDEQRRRAAERRVSAAQAERVRIARELHDVLAHSLSQINVQAGVGLHLIDRDPEQGRLALANIKAASKTALDEVRSVLGILRDDGAAGAAPLVPEPGLAQLPALVDGVREQGVAVTLELRLPGGDGLEGDGPEGDGPGRAVQLAAYRIVQESLTNVLRHSGGGAARVVVGVERVAVGVEGRMLVLTVEDDGGVRAAPARGDGDGGGRGLEGMRERAELLGGRFEAGPRAGGGFGVRAELPLGSGAGGAGAEATA